VPVELLHHAFPSPGATHALAQRLEAAGWDGLVLADSQNLVADPFMELALAASPTSLYLRAVKPAAK
jgi:5,10-methylenetetrahydromethanopterin reductase